MNAPAPQTHRYGDHEDQVADLRLPEGPGPHPVAVLLHGGFWRSRYDRKLMAPMADDLATRGWASWNVEYRRGGESGHGRDTVADVQAALAEIARVDAPLDPRRWVVIGHSAGGHLALLTASASRAALVISLAGVTDLRNAFEDDLGNGAVTEFLGVDPDDDPTLYRDLSPIARLPSGTRTLLVHGDLDDTVPVGLSRSYEWAARAAGDACELLELPGVDHFAVIDPDDEPYAAWVSRLPGG